MTPLGSRDLLSETRKKAYDEQPESEGRKLPDRIGICDPTRGDHIGHLRDYVPEPSPGETCSYCNAPLKVYVQQEERT